MLGRVDLASFPSDWMPARSGRWRPGIPSAIIQYGQGILGQRSQRFGVGRRSRSCLIPYPQYAATGRFDLIGLKGQHFGARSASCWAARRSCSSLAATRATAGKIYGKPQGWIRSRRNGQQAQVGAHV